MKGLVVVAALLANASAAVADTQLVLINAAPRLGDDNDGIANVKRTLDSRGMLADLPTGLQETLLGQSVAIEHTDAIKDAFVKEDYDAALELIDNDEKRILQNVGSGDPTFALAELSQWRGL